MMKVVLPFGQDLQTAHEGAVVAVGKVAEKAGEVSSSLGPELIVRTR